MQNSASEFDDSFPEFGVYSSSGRLLHGSEIFKESTEYTELAKQLDIKRSALYVETRGSEILLGCSLLVKIWKGREERAVFMECFPKEAVSQDPIWINNFYTDAITKTERLQSIRYKVLGLWKEADIYLLSFPENPKKPPVFLERKVLLGEKVSIWIPDLSGGLSMLACLIFKLKYVPLPNFSLALSLYPSKTDISAGPGETAPDFTLEDGEIQFYTFDNYMANSKGIISQIQKDDVKEQKAVLDSDNVLGNDYSKARNVGRKMNKIKQGTRIVIYACIFFLLLIVKFLLLIVELLLLIVGLSVLSKISLELVFP